MSLSPRRRAQQRRIEPLHPPRAMTRPQELLADLAFLLVVITAVSGLAFAIATLGLDTLRHLGVIR